MRQLLAEIGAEHCLYPESHAGIAVQESCDVLFRPRDITRRFERAHGGRRRAAADETDLTDEIAIFQLRYLDALGLDADAAIVDQHHVIQWFLFDGENLALLCL